MGKTSILIPEEPSRRLGCWNGRKQGCRVCGWIRTAEAGFGPRFGSHGVTDRACGKTEALRRGDLEGKLTVTYIGLEAMYHRMQERTRGRSGAQEVSGGAGDVTDRVPAERN